MVALLGPNGAGKTTTIRSILGLSRPRSGQIRFDGLDITRRPTHEIARLGIGWVPDDRRIFPEPDGRAQSAARHAPHAVPSLDGAGDVRDLPGAGTSDRTANARTCRAAKCRWSRSRARLLGSPGIVLLDEPSQGLAPKIVQDVLKTVMRLKREGISVLIVEQNARAALEVCDRVYVMERGRIVHQGAAAELLANPALRRRLIGM